MRAYRYLLFFNPLLYGVIRMMNSLFVALSLSAIPFAATLKPAPVAPLPVSDIEILCGGDQKFPLVEPYCAYGEFLGLTPQEMVDDIAGRWENYIVGYMDCGPCSDPGSCLPSAEFEFGTVQIEYVGPPASFKVCFTDASIFLACGECDA
jgi:hypothetical protein